MVACLYTSVLAATRTESEQMSAFAHCHRFPVPENVADDVILIAPLVSNCQANDDKKEKKDKAAEDGQQKECRGCIETHSVTSMF